MSKKNFPNINDGQDEVCNDQNSQKLLLSFGRMDNIEKSVSEYPRITVLIWRSG